MKRHFLMITTAASILVCGSVAASAQDDSETPDIQLLEQAQQQDAVDQDASPDTDGHGRVRHCMQQCMRGMK
jgi:hypothetical protein